MRNSNILTIGLKLKQSNLKTENKLPNILPLYQQKK